MWDVVFQFWFVAGLMGYVTLLAPFRNYLKSVRDKVKGGIQSPESSWGGALGLFHLLGGYVVLAMIFSLLIVPVAQLTLAAPLVSFTKGFGEAAQFWGLPTTLDESRDFLKDLLSYFQLSLSNIYLAVAFPLVSTQLGNCGWLMLFNTYAHKCFLYRAEFARAITGFDFTLLGMVCYFYGLSKRRLVGEYMIRYWFLVLFAGGCLCAPGTQGRFDEHPPTDLPTRARDNVLELIFAVLFLCAVERLVDHKIFTQDRMDFISNWTLLLYLVHVAIFLLAPQPLNYVLMVALMWPVYYATPRPTSSLAS